MVNQNQAFAKRPTVLASWTTICTATPPIGNYLSLVDHFMYGGANTNLLPLPVPRACRLWGYAVNAISNPYVGDVQFALFVSDDCGFNAPKAIAQVFPINFPGPGAQRWCVANKVGLSIDKNEVWYPALTFPNGGIDNPQIQLTLQFDLR